MSASQPAQKEPLKSSPTIWSICSSFPGRVDGQEGCWLVVNGLTIFCITQFIIKCCYSDKKTNKPKKKLDIISRSSQMSGPDDWFAFQQQLWWQQATHLLAWGLVNSIDCTRSQTQPNWDRISTATSDPGVFCSNMNIRHLNYSLNSNMQNLLVEDMKFIFFFPPFTSLWPQTEQAKKSTGRREKPKRKKRILNSAAGLLYSRRTTSVRWLFLE